jgi:hypothetical protein
MSDDNEELEALMSKLDKSIFLSIAVRGKLARIIERNKVSQPGK